ncbi:Hsp20 family protein [Candidatus Bathyarchaeota archaeon]|nr:Hsp20 family protein [Candidatus Bathyarchaeota archaeon]
MTKKKRKIYRPFDDDDDEDGDDPFAGFPFGDDMGSFFNDFMKKMTEMMRSKDFFNFSQNVFKNLGIPGPEMMDEEELKKRAQKGGAPFVYGFSVRMGPDGRPIIDRFGNIKPSEMGENEGALPAADDVGNVREPLADLIEEEKEIVVVVELPGVQKEDIELMATEYTLEIHAADSEGMRVYQKRMELPGKINPDVAKARYTNGILEVRLVKVEDEKRRGSPIKIE